MYIIIYTFCLQRIDRTVVTISISKTPVEGNKPTNTVLRILDQTVSFFSNKPLDFGDKDEHISDPMLADKVEPDDDIEERDGAGACSPESPTEYVVESAPDFSIDPDIGLDSDCTLIVTFFKTARSGTCTREMLLLLTHVQYASCS